MSRESGAAEPAAAPAGARAVFLDKDGTLVENVPYNVDPAQLRFTPHALEGLRLLVAHGWQLIVVTNQPGLAYGLFNRSELMRLRSALAALMVQGGAPLTDFYSCPHAPGAVARVPACLCRKPAPGLLRQAARRHALELSRCWMVGDILDDVEAGARAGCRTLLLDVGNETEWRTSPLRTPDARAGDLLQAARLIVAADAQCGAPIAGYGVRVAESQFATAKASEACVDEARVAEAKLAAARLADVSAVESAGRAPTGCA